MEQNHFILLQLIVSGALVLLQLSTIPVFLVYQELRRRVLYRIMLSIALSDFLQLFAIFQFTFYQFIGWEYSKWTLKFASGVYIIAWDHLIIQHFLLAINRLIIIYKALYSPTNYKQESSLENGIFNFFLILSWLLMGGMEVAFMTPYCAGVWDSDAVGFFYDTSLVCCDYYRQWEFYLTIVFPAVSISCYLAIILILKKTRNVGHGQSLVNPQNQQKTGKMKLNNQEKRILFISIVLFSLITAMIFAWYVDYKNPPWTMLFCGYLFINSSLTLTMNSEYRRHFFQMWRTIFRFFLPCLIREVKKPVQKSLAAKTTTHNINTAVLFIRRTSKNIALRNQRELTERSKSQRF